MKQLKKINPKIDYKLNNPIYDSYTEHLEVIVELAKVSQMLNLDVDVMKQRECYYEHDVMQNGSFKGITDGESYQREMDGRYNRIECKINEGIEAKLEYNKRTD